MGKFFKLLSIILFLLSAFIFSLVAYGESIIPDELNLQSQSTVPLNPIYTAELSDDERAVNASYRSEKSFGIDVEIMGLIPVKTCVVTAEKRQYVTLGGDIIGLKIYSDGVMVVGTSFVQTNDGQKNPSKEAGIAIGDIIVSIDGEKAENSNNVAKKIAESGGKSLNVEIRRNDDTIYTELCAVKSVTDERYKTGLWIRDSQAGIGTVTFYDSETGIFASLGHAVCDVDTKKLIPVSEGEAVEAKITGVYKGVEGSAGELCGVFTGKSKGALFVNGSTGAYGKSDKKNFGEEIIPVATRCEVKEGKAQIICTVTGNEKKKYDIEIKKISSDENTNANMTVKIIDRELLEKTGGIVQGMSGSPIVQNGMLVGAITHVFVNEPTEGYGIFAETMLETTKELSEKIEDVA